MGGKTGIVVKIKVDEVNHSCNIVIFNEKYYYLIAFKEQVVMLHATFEFFHCQLISITK